MRTQSPSAIGSLVGIIITSTTIIRPDGIPPDKTEQTLSPEQRRQGRFLRYLRQLGRHDQAAWMEREFKAIARTKAIIETEQKRSVFQPQPLSDLAFSWAINLTLLSATLLMLVFWLAAELLAKSRWQKSPLVFLLFGLLWLLCLGHLWHVGAVKTILAVSQVLADLLAWQDRATTLLLILHPAVLQFPFIMLVAIVPLAVVAVAIAICIAKDERVSSALVQGLRRWAWAVACILFLCYAFALTDTAAKEQNLDAAIAQCLQNEVSYYGSLGSRAR